MSHQLPQTLKAKNLHTINEFFNPLSLEKKVQITKVHIPKIFKAVKSIHKCPDCGASSCCFSQTEAPLFHKYFEFLAERASRLSSIQSISDELYHEEEALNKSKCCTDFVFDALYVDSNFVIPSNQELMEDDFVKKIHTNLAGTPKLKKMIKNCADCNCGLNVQTSAAHYVLHQIREAYNLEIAQVKADKAYEKLLQESTSKSKRKRKRKQNKKPTKPTNPILSKKQTQTDEKKVVEPESNNHPTPTEFNTDPIHPQVHLENAHTDTRTDSNTDWIQVGPSGKKQPEKRKQKSQTDTQSSPPKPTQSISPKLQNQTEPSVDTSRIQQDPSPSLSEKSTPIQNKVQPFIEPQAAIIPSHRAKPNPSMSLTELEHLLSKSISERVNTNFESQQELLNMLHRAINNAHTLFYSPRNDEPMLPLCNEFCAVPSCYSPCMVEGTHQQHFCSAQECFDPCLIPGCQYQCASEDHLHQLGPNFTGHNCGNHEGEALCGRECEIETCPDPCAVPWYLEHEEHGCISTMTNNCENYCITPGCEQVCDKRDHYHSVVEDHLCVYHSNCFTLPDIFDDRR